MSILVWIIFGGIAGWIATLVTGNASKYGILGNILIGIAGAIVGGVIANLLGINEAFNTTLSSFITAVLGSVLLLFIFGALRGPAKY